MLKTLRDLKERKTYEMQEMLEQMQKMRQSRIEEVWRHLQEMPHTIKAAEMSLQEGQRKLLLARREEERILNKISSHKYLADWVQARKSCRNRMLERALERAMRRALVGKLEEWERQEWEKERLDQWDQERKRKRLEEQDRLWGKGEGMAKGSERARLRGGEWEWEEEQGIRNQQWRQEWERREKKRQELDQVELKELESEESQLRRRQTQGKGGEELERELQLARDWINLGLDLDLNLLDLNSELSKSLELWQRLVNQPSPLALINVKDEQDLHRLEKMHQRLNEAKARLEEHQATDATKLEEASSDWKKLNQLADEWLALDPTQDRLPLVEREVKEQGCQRYLLSIMLDNQSAFAAHSAYLDALLVFVSTSLLGLNQGTDVYGYRGLIIGWFILSHSLRFSHRNSKRPARRSPP